MPEAVDVEALEEATGAEEPSWLERFRLRAGLLIAAAILGLIILVLGLISLFAWQTYPDLSEIRTVQPDRTKALEIYDREKTSWFGQIKDLLQLLVVSLLVPIL